LEGETTSRSRPRRFDALKRSRVGDHHHRAHREGEEVDFRFQEDALYHGAGRQNGLDIFAPIREARERKDVVGIGRLVLSRREHSVMIQRAGKGTADDLADPKRRLPDEIFDDIKEVKVDTAEPRHAETLLEQEAEFDLSVRDRYQAATQDWFDADEGQEDHASPEVERPANVCQPIEADEDSVARKAARVRRRAAAKAAKEGRTPQRKRA